MSINIKKQRIYVYNKSFMKWELVKRLSMLEQTSIESTLAIHKFGNNPSDPNFKKLCESISDFETMIEVAELTFPALRPEMDRIIKQKLTVLNKSSSLNNTANKLEEKAEGMKKKAAEFPQAIKKKRSFWDKLFLRNK